MKNGKIVLGIVLIFALSILGQGYVPNHVIVKYKKALDSAEIQKICSQLGLKEVKRNEKLNLVTYEIPAGKTVKEVIQTLQKYPTIDYAEPDYIYRHQTGARVLKTVNNSSRQSSGADTARVVKPFYQVKTKTYVKDELLVKFKPSIAIQDITALTEQLGIQMIKTIPRIGVQRYRIAKPEKLQETIKKLLANPKVEYAEPNFILHALEIPNDPAFSNLWGLNNTGQTGGKSDADIDAPEAWDKNKGSKNIIVAIIDTGIDYEHPDLKDNIWINNGEIPGNGVDDDNNGFVDDVHGWDFRNNDSDPMDDNRHGTHCAGTIGAVGNNSEGVVGVNWQVQLMALKFLDASGSGSTSDALEAIIYAVDNGAKILSNSWGGGGFSQSLKDAIEYADQHNALFVAAAGNSSSDNDQSPSYPASYDVENVISVAASNDRDYLASFSNYGARTVDLAAPGESILSTVPGNGYQYLSGTSMATPHVSGAAALAWNYFAARADHHFVKYCLFGAVDYLSNMEGKVLMDGRLNINNALRNTPLVAVIEKPEDKVAPNTAVTIQASAVDNDSITAVELTYKISGGSSGSATITMNKVREYVYQAQIPGAADKSTVEYWVAATDNDNNTTETRHYTYQVGQGGGSCCGAFAVTLPDNGKNETVVATILLNLLFVFAPVGALRWWFKKR